MPKHLLPSRGSITASLIAITVCIASTQWIYANVAAPENRQRPPLPVAVTTYTLADHYERKVAFAGVTRAQHESSLGFEVGGTIDRVLVTEGMAVAAGTPLAQLNSDRRNALLDATKAEMKRLRAELELATLRHQRTANLAAAGLTSQQSLDDATLAERALQASYEAAQARVATHELDITKSTLLAPYDGIVAQRMAEPGTVVGAGTPVLRLLTSEGLEARIGLPVEQANRLTVGTPYTLRSVATVVEAPLIGLRHDVEAATLTVIARFAWPENQPIRAGESVLLEVTEELPERGGWLPMTALLEGERGLWNVLVVSQVGAEYITQRELVEVLWSEKDRVFVRGTLADGTWVVATGVHRLSPGSSVEPRLLGVSAL